jgi:hypothetical protein
MQKPSSTPATPSITRVDLEPRSGRMSRAWNRFWFTPTDPIVLGVIRICAGLVALYSVIIFGFDLQEFFGERAWLGLEERLASVRESPWFIEPWFGTEPLRPAVPKSAVEKEYVDWYAKTFHGLPPLPFPQSNEEANELAKYHREWGIDPRATRLPLPEAYEHSDYIKSYIRKWGSAPPLPWPKDEAEARSFDEYRAKWGADPRTLVARGIPAWSVWFHVTDPGWMLFVHYCIVACVFFLVIGFCTRITSVLAWAGMLCYIHRDPLVLFGVDTMVNIMLLYLMIGPSGAALSVDRLLARWWASAGPRVVGRWRAFWDRLFGRPPAAEPPTATAPVPLGPPAPSVSANVAIRLIQIHVCIIYAAAGLTKLLGDQWWRGIAVWKTLASYEFAPMNNSLYLGFLHVISKNALVLNLVVWSGTAFTLMFEICYAFLIWRPATRKLLLAAAVTLHGFIGMFMGLKTFALIMLVMNIAFLTPAEVRWLLSAQARSRFLDLLETWALFGLGWVRWLGRRRPARAVRAVESAHARHKRTAVRAGKEPPTGTSEQIQAKK